MKKVVLLIGVLLLLTGLGLRTLWSWWHSPLPDQAAVIITIEEGSSLSAVASRLSRQGVLRWPVLWTQLARLQELDQQIHKGEYALAADMSPGQILEALVQGRVVQYSVTLPEGITLSAALSILQQQDAVKVLLDGSSDPRLLELVSPQSQAEGLFFPDTYVFSRGETDLGILKQAHRRMQSVLSSAWRTRDAGLPYQSAYEALIMASIVEKETGLASEREQIAGVFVRRLGKSMRLQTDPTIIYGLGEDYQGNLRRRHLEDSANPYNTYRHKGLPPSPIALPGADAIHAALNPAAGSTLYFVARGDGSHQFSDTLEEHQRAVRQYQLKRRKDYRSAPPSGDDS